MEANGFIANVSPWKMAPYLSGSFLLSSVFPVADQSGSSEMKSSCQILSLQSRTQQNLSWACVKMLNCTQETDWRIKNSPPTVEDYCSGLQGNYPVSNFNRIFCNLTNIYGYFFKAIKLLCWENAAGAPAARTNFVDFFLIFMLDLLHRNEIYSVIALTMSTQCVCVCVCLLFWNHSA